VPELKRSPFETLHEFFERMPKQSYYVGEIELLADRYNISTGKFPLRFANVRGWAQDLVSSLCDVHLLLPREQAGVLFQKGRSWPVYVWLEVAGSRIGIKVLKTLTSQGEYLLKMTPEYEVYGNGIVRDNRTGLEWIAGLNKDTNWNEAKSWVKELKITGGGWRMPAMHELEGLYKKGAGNQNMTSLLKTTGLGVWSGETKGSSGAWYFNFRLGNRYWLPRDYSSTTMAFAVRSRNGGKDHICNDHFVTEQKCCQDCSTIPVRPAATTAPVRPVRLKLTRQMLGLSKTQWKKYRAKRGFKRYV
jgi:hypothetical protein